MKPFTPQDVVQKIRELAQKQPDFIYTDQPEYKRLLDGTPHEPNAQCSYVAGAIGATTGQACIVGQALSGLGVPEGILRQFEGDSGGELVYSLSVLDESSFEAEAEAEAVKDCRWVNDVQSHQDNGLTWSHAVSFADESEVERSLYK